jgi:hypothetical protein
VGRGGRNKVWKGFPGAYYAIMSDGLTRGWLVGKTIEERLVSVHSTGSVEIKGK